jgi:hypothetical protein
MASGKVTVGTTATTVRAGEERKQLIVTNLSGTTTIYFSVDGGTPTPPSGANPGTPLGPGERYLVNRDDLRSVVCNAPIIAITAAGTAEVAFNTIT